jgi:hypothetical protein
VQLESSRGQEAITCYAEEGISRGRIDERERSSSGTISQEDVQIS